MIRGKGHYDWSMTCAIMAQQINMNRKKGTRCIDPETLNPYHERKPKKRAKRIVAKDLFILRDVFCKKKQ